MFKLRTQKETFLRAKPIYSNLTYYCRFGNFRENFIFANSVKRHICDAQSWRQRHDLNVSVNNRLNLIFREGFIFTKLRICEVSRKFPNLQYSIQNMPSLPIRNIVWKHLLQTIWNQIRLFSTEQSGQGSSTLLS